MYSNKVFSEWGCLVALSNSLRPHGLQSTRLLCPWGFSRQEHWSGLPSPPSRGLPTQGLNPDLPHCRQILNCLSHQRNRTLEWVASPFSKGTSWHRNKPVSLALQMDSLPAELPGKPRQFFLNCKILPSIAIEKKKKHSEQFGIWLK